MLRIVERPVGLDHQPMPQAHEIEDIAAGWDLPAELQAFQPTVPQQLPKLTFDRRGGPPQRARLGNRRAAPRRTGNLCSTAGKPLIRPAARATFSRKGRRTPQSSVAATPPARNAAS